MLSDNEIKMSPVPNNCFIILSDLFLFCFRPEEKINLEEILRPLSTGYQGMRFHLSQNQSFWTILFHGPLVYGSQAVMTNFSK